MDDKKRKAFDNFAKGGAAMAVAARELKLSTDAVKVAGAHGVGTAIEFVRQSKAVKKSKRSAQKAARRRNR